MAHVRVALPEERAEELWIALAPFDPVGVDEGNLASGDLEFLIYFPSADEARACAGALAAFGASLIEAQANENWNAAWQATWRPMAVGQRFWLAPPDSREPVPDGRWRLDYHPGLAFGNGDHPTTQMCLELLEEHVRPGDRVLDLGCGSGLLCEAAILLGAQGIGCDLDEAALAQARLRGLAVFQGSIDAVGAADVIVANLARGTLDALWPEIRRAARRQVIASGLLAEQREALDGFAVVRERGGWLAGALTF